MNQDIDIQALAAEVDKLQSIAFAAATLKKHGQVDFVNTVELLKLTHTKIGELLYPPELGTVSELAGGLMDTEPETP